MTRIVVFDVGGVLINHDPKNLYRKLLPDEEAVDAFLTNICDHDWNEQQDAGRSLADATAERVALFPEHTELITAYYDRWEEMLDGPIQGTVDIFDALKAGGKPVYGLSNFSAETFQRARTLFPFLDWFTGLVVSGEDGLIKPDPQIYHLLMSRFDLVAEDLIFIDDREKNVTAANELGIHGLLFETPERLGEDLRRLEVI